MRLIECLWLCFCSWWTIHWTHHIRGTPISVEVKDIKDILGFSSMVQNMLILRFEVVVEDAYILLKAYILSLMNVFNTVTAKGINTLQTCLTNVNLITGIIFWSKPGKYWKTECIILCGEMLSFELTYFCISIYFTFPKCFSRPDSSNSYIARHVMSASC